MSSLKKISYEAVLHIRGDAKWPRPVLVLECGHFVDKKDHKGQKRFLCIECRYPGELGDYDKSYVLTPKEDFDNGVIGEPIDKLDKNSVDILERRAIRILVNGPDGDVYLSANKLNDWLFDAKKFWLKEYGATDEEYRLFMHSPHIEKNPIGGSVFIQCNHRRRNGKQCKNHIPGISVTGFADFLDAYRQGGYCHVHGGTKGG